MQENTDQLKQDKKLLEEDITAWRKLQSVALNDEFDKLVDRLVKTVADKMIYAFTSDKINTIEDFYRIRGEVIARLQPLQEIATAGAMAETLEKQLKEYYAPKA